MFQSPQVLITNFEIESCLHDHFKFGQWIRICRTYHVLFYFSVLNFSFVSLSKESFWFCNESKAYDDY